MQTSDDAKHGLALRFEVVVNGHDLGGWSTCSGLAMSFDVEKVKEGGENTFIHQLPGRAQYEHIVLQRAMTAGCWNDTRQWLKQVQQLPKPAPAQITLYDAWKGKVATWDLNNVYPVKWSGPKLDAKGSEVAVETLELAHEGFLD
ncbi:MAG TPA: phage tail protein [Acidimicrobiales bacterium]|jgi:phage tail-like protein|nr:phage tail protein [Acidimicrobiales bacterium]